MNKLKKTIIENLKNSIIIKNNLKTQEIII